MIPENERARRGKAPLYKTNARERSQAFRGEEEQQRATQADEKSPTPYAVGASNNLGWWSKERVEGALRVRTPVAARNLRDDDEKAAERKERREPERGMEAHKLAR